MAGSAPRIGVIDASGLGSAASGSPSETLSVCAATPGDAEAVIETVAQAFLQDPTWSWAYPAPEARRAWWSFCIRSALRYPWVLKTGGYEAVSVWIPPGGTELSPEEDDLVPGILDSLVGARAPIVMELLSRFGASHPRHQPHYYLSLLGVADRHRGRGLGIALLRENLARIDAEGSAAYLESSNPHNDKRYQALGFRPIGSFTAPEGGPTITGMWRDAR
jgi:GNAT superfamily N-acetyltransferase